VIGDDDQPIIYVVRPSNRVANRIEAEHLRQAQLSGPAAADTWEDTLMDAIVSFSTLVDFVPHPKQGEEGCLLKVFNALGDPLAIVAVPPSAVKALRSDEVMAVRRLAQV